jgi:acyl-CoA thioesterase-1
MDKQPLILTVQRNSTADVPHRRPRTASGRRRFLQAAGLVALWAGLAFSAGHAQDTSSAGSGAKGAEPLILVVGDSLSAEYGIGRGEGWVTLLEQRTAPQGWNIVNASISGETSAGGLTRLPALLKKHLPSITIIELGANDALRGLPMAATEANLRKMVELARAAASRPLLVGMMMPPNFGPAYARQFSEMYKRVAETEKIALVPFLLEGFADDLNWFQPDRIHPTAKAQPRMLDNVWPVLSKML